MLVCDINDMVTYILSIFSLIVSVTVFVKTRKTDRYKVTFEAYSGLQEYLYFLYEYNKNEIEEFIDDKTSREYKAISSSVAQIELFATAVKRRLYDIEVVYDLAHGYLDMTLRNRIEYIIDQKGENAREEFYSNTIWLLKEMDKRSKKNGNI